MCKAQRAHHPLRIKRWARRNAPLPPYKLHQFSSRIYSADGIYCFPMTGHRPFGELTRSFTPARRARVAAKAAALREAMTLEELRKARSLSQEEVAAALTVNQPAVAKLEKRGDMHVSNLRRYIEALGGTLEITAHFDKTTVVISNIGETL